MSKKNTILILASFILFAFSSCKTHERCPAYGKTNTVKAKNMQPA